MGFLLTIILNISSDWQAQIHGIGLSSGSTSVWLTFSAPLMLSSRSPQSSLNLVLRLRSPLLILRIFTVFIRLLNYLFSSSTVVVWNFFLGCLDFGINVCRPNVFEVFYFPTTILLLNQILYFIFGRELCSVFWELTNCK